jgi:hypothetical protein
LNGTLSIGSRTRCCAIGWTRLAALVRSRPSTPVQPRRRLPGQRRRRARTGRCRRCTSCIVATGLSCVRSVLWASTTALCALDFLRDGGARCVSLLAGPLHCSSTRGGGRRDAPRNADRRGVGVIVGSPFNSGVLASGRSGGRPLHLRAARCPNPRRSVERLRSGLALAHVRQPSWRQRCSFP